MKNEKFSKTLLAMLFAVSSFGAAMANDESYLNNEPIDINGYYKEPAPVTDQELEKVKKELDHQKQTIILNKQKSKKYKELGKTTEKLADATEELIEDRNESQAEIDHYNKKISCLMGETEGSECDEFVKSKDKVSTVQAAPTQAEVQAPVVNQIEEKSNNQIKVLPYTGLTTFNGENESLEAEISMGLKVESDINERFSIGMGLGYTTLKTTDFGGFDPYFTSSFYNYYNNFYHGREIEYDNLRVDLYSKFFITRGERFRPYIGGGVAYNRTTMKYSDNRSLNPYVNNMNSYAYQFGNEELITSLMSLQLEAGTEILFTDAIGMNLEIQYSRGLGSKFGTKNGLNTFNAPDQKRLQDLNNEINGANSIGVFAGMLILF